MDTVAKGNVFEARVFEAIKRELDAERLGLSPKACEIFCKKKYYSRDRDSGIETDISIEVSLPDAPNWSLLWVIECKDYRGSLPVDDVEEFHAKVQQISGDNVKATLAVSGALQMGALKYATSKGMGVVRILPDDQISWVLYQVRLQTSSSVTRLSSSEFFSALTTPDFIGKNRSFYACDDEYIYGDWFSLIKSTLCGQ